MPGSAESPLAVWSTRLSCRCAHVWPIWPPRSSTRCCTPARDSAADVARPAGPAPTMSDVIGRASTAPPYNVLRYSINARRFASVWIRDQKSWPALRGSGTRAVEPVSIVAEPADELGLGESRLARILVERLTDAHAIERRAAITWKIFGRSEAGPSK